MKIVVFYFSGNGNTKWLVDELSKHISMKESDIRSISIEKVNEKDISEYSWLC